MRKRYFKLSVESHIHFRMQSVIMTPGGRDEGGGVRGLSLMTFLNSKKLSNFKNHELP